MNIYPVLRETGNGNKEHPDSEQQFVVQTKRDLNQQQLIGAVESGVTLFLQIM